MHKRGWSVSSLSRSGTTAYERGDSREVSRSRGGIGLRQTLSEGERKRQLLERDSERGGSLRGRKLGNMCKGGMESVTLAGKLPEKRKKVVEEGEEPALVSFEELPEYMKENEFIRGYYRMEWPIKHAIKSIFRWHNETLNVWT